MPRAERRKKLQVKQLEESAAKLPKLTSFFSKSTIHHEELDNNQDNITWVYVGGAKIFSLKVPLFVCAPPD